jgi:hypothetical protein
VHVTSNREGVHVTSNREGLHVTSNREGVHVRVSNNRGMPHAPQCGTSVAPVWHQCGTSVAPQLRRDLVGLIEVDAIRGRVRVRYILNPGVLHLNGGLGLGLASSK